MGGSGGGAGGPDPPFGPRYRLFNIGPKVGPLLPPPARPPFFLLVDLRWTPPPFSKILDPPLISYTGIKCLTRRSTSEVARVPGGVVVCHAARGLQSVAVLGGVARGTPVDHHIPVTVVRVVPRRGLRVLTARKVFLAARCTTCINNIHTCSL